MTAFWYNLSKLLCWLFFRIGFGLKVTGQENVPKQGACIIAANHVSYLDPIVVGTACPRRLTFMARNTLYRQSFLRWWLNSVGAIALNRDESDVSAVRAAVAALRGGKPVALFPEGTRQESGRLSQAKRGVGLLAQLGQVPVVPMYIEGTYEALPRGEKKLKPAKIRVALGAPIAYTNVLVPPSSASVDLPALQRAGERALRADQERIANQVTASWQQLKSSLSVKA